MCGITVVTFSDPNAPSTAQDYKRMFDNHVYNVSLQFQRLDSVLRIIRRTRIDTKLIKTSHVSSNNGWTPKQNREILQIPIHHALVHL
jgi:hypothetical protein